MDLLLYEVHTLYSLIIDTVKVVLTELPTNTVHIILARVFVVSDLKPLHLNSHSYFNGNTG